MVHALDSQMLHNAGVVVAELVNVAIDEQGAGVGAGETIDACPVGHKVWHRR